MIAKLLENRDIDFTLIYEDEEKQSLHDRLRHKQAACMQKGKMSSSWVVTD